GPPAPHASRTARGVGLRRPLAAPGADPRCRPRRRAVAARAARPALTPGARPLSIAASALLVVAAAVLATLIGRAMLGRLIPAARATETEPTAHAVLEAMAALYGVLVAFVLAGAWDRLDQTRLALTLEANAITDLQQTARILPAPTRDELGRAVDAYRESVLEELRLLAAGRTSTEPDALVD